MSEIIDSGTYGNIYLVNSHTVNKESQIYDEGFCWQSLKELIILSQFKDTYIPKLQKFEVNDKITLTLPHLDINLLTYMETFADDFPEEDFTPEEFDEFIIEQKINFLYSFIFQMSRALVYLHGNGIIHNDIKPENIMVDSKENITIIDFGSAIFTDTKVSFCTNSYRAPEAFWHKLTTFSSDIWSLGITCLFILNNYCIMDHITIENCDQNLIDRKLSDYLKTQSFHCTNLPFQSKYLNSELYNLISKMLTFDYKSRISATEIYCSSIFSNFDKSFKNIIIFKYNDVSNAPVFELRSDMIKLIFNLCKIYPKSIILTLLTFDRFCTLKTPQNYILSILSSFILANSIYYPKSIEVNTKIKKLTKLNEDQCIVEISKNISDILVTLSGSIYRLTFDHMIENIQISMLQQFCLYTDFRNKTQSDLANEYMIYKN